MPFQGGTISYTSFWGDTSVDSYSTVGFHSGRGTEHMKNVERFVKNPDTLYIPGTKNDHQVLYQPSDSGAELWGGSYPPDPDDPNQHEFFGFDPHFFGKSRMAISITDKFEDEPLVNECTFRGRARPVEKGPDFQPPNTGNFMEMIGWMGMNMCQFEFFCPNYQLFGDCIQVEPSVGFKFPTYVVQCCAFAKDIRVFDTPDDYRTFRKNEVAKGRLGMEEKSFCSLAAPLPEEKRSQEVINACLALITGVVKETELKVNEKTGKTFYWALVETHAGCQFDVVIHPALLGRNGGSPPPKVGGIVQGIFYISGRFLPGALEKAWWGVQNE